MRDYFCRLANDDINGAFPFLLKGILFLLSLIYGLLSQATHLLYACGILRSYKPDCRVISVGNITWGGTGKTPLVQFLADYLSKQGKNPAVIIRGYRRMAQASQESADYKNMGDEAFMHLQELDIPVVVGRDRVAAAKRARQEFGADTVILDDGFQHWRIKRDLDIVVIDTTNPFGNGRLIPRGILREPLSALRRADIFFLSRSDQATEKISGLRERLNHINPSALIVEAVHRPAGFYDILHKEHLFKLEDVKGKVAAICSIGNPAAFLRTLAGLGITPQPEFRFPDHHHYRQSEIRAVIAFCGERGIDTLVTTSKDEVRLRDFLESIRPQLRVLVLQVRTAITKGQDEFFGRLSGMYSA